MKQKQKYSFQVSRKKMRAIAKALGLPSDDYYSPQQFMTLAAKIYGAADEDVVAACREYAANDQAKKPLDAEWAVLENDPDALIVKIQEQFPTAKEFLAMKKRQKDSFQVSGKKIDAIARALGLPSDDYVYPQPFMTLATKIYGANDPDICAAQERLAAKTEAATVVPGDGDEEQGRRAQKRRAGEPNWEQAV